MIWSRESMRSLECGARRSCARCQRLAGSARISRSRVSAFRTLDIWGSCCRRSFPDTSRSSAWRSSGVAHSRRVTTLPEHLRSRWSTKHSLESSGRPIRQVRLRLAIDCSSRFWRPPRSRSSGVVADVRHAGPTREADPQVYIPDRLYSPQVAFLALRAAGDPLRTVDAIRAQVRAIDANQSVTDVKMMDEILERAAGQRHLAARVLGLFAATALLLAVIGLYGVMAYSVAQRTQEIGIRRALGAGHREVLWMVVGQGLRVTIVGIVCGVAAAYALHAAPRIAAVRGEHHGRGDVRRGARRLRARGAPGEPDSRVAGGPYRSGRRPA